MTATTRRAAPDAELSSAELLACWESLGLGEPPALLRIRRPGLTDADRRACSRLLSGALAGLAARGLSDGAHPTPGLAGMLRVLAHADYHLDIRFGGPTRRPVLGIGAVHGTRAVMLLSYDGAAPIQLWATESTNVAHTLLGLLGDVPAGRGNPVNIPTTTLDQALHAATDTGIWALTGQLHTRGISSTDASSLARMCTGITFGGQLGATGRYGGPDRRGPWTIGFHRARNGGYFMRLRRDHTLTVCPTNTARLRRQWTTLVNHLPHPPIT
jgi:hypothetical protein